jgi:hypothetical protein
MNYNKGETKMTIEQYLDQVGFADNGSLDYADYLAMCDRPYWDWTQDEELLANQLEEALHEGLITETPAFVKEPAQ